MSLELDKILGEVNLADKMDDQELDKIGEDVVRGYEADLQSRKDWETQHEEYMALALQIKKEKTFPWPKAANVKYPLLTTAALQFASRAYAALVPSFDVVKAKPIGKDPEGKAMEMAENISTHMSYQVLYEMDDWEEQMDKLCLILPIMGCAFKKTYYSHVKGHNCSELILPKDLVVDYWAKSLETATRKTHKFWLTPNEIIARQRQELFREYEGFNFDGGQLLPSINEQGTSKLQPPAQDEDTPRLTLEQHTFLDLDEDGYKEPYVVIVDYESKKVHRIAPRFRSKDIKRKNGKLVEIKPCEYFTKFSFIPNPDGGFYDVGFGLLLGSLNESANTSLNQLLDAGALSNLQPGFLAKGLRIGKGGEIKFAPGEWKWVNNSYEDLKKGVFPLPVREPSNVLFQLLGMLVQAGKEMASIAEIFTGKMPGQNTPASTTMATIEQGLKVFTSIYKRIYRALGREFEKLAALNEVYLEQDTEYSFEKEGVVFDMTISPETYSQARMKIIPAADPNMVTETQKLMQLQAMMEMAQFGQLNVQELTRRGLEIHGIPSIGKLLEVPEPPPPIEIQIQQMKMQDAAEDRKLEQLRLMAESQKMQSEIMLNIAKAKQLGDEVGAMQLEAQLKREEAQMDIQVEIMKMQLEKEKHQLEMAMKRDEHALDMEVKQITAAQDIKVNEVLGAEKVRQTKEMGDTKIEQTKKSGDMKLDQSKKLGDQKVAQAKAQAKMKPKK